MRLSKFFVFTLRETPKDADVVSHRLMLKASMIRKLLSGVYEWLPLGLRVLKKFESIIREEMNKAGAHEVLLPALLPKSLWQETGRWSQYGKELFRLKDRKDSDMCLGPTHEEIITDLVRSYTKSWKDFPLILYQIQVKFRDEIRPRFGVLRAREFIMKDAYSFDINEEKAEESYWKMFEAYKRICKRIGFDFSIVEASTGLIGGKFSHEFMVNAETGEEEIVSCKNCGYAANMEKVEFEVESRSWKVEDERELEEVYTPDKKTVYEVSEFLKAERKKFIKTLIYSTEKENFIVLLPGDREVNKKKLDDYIGEETKLAEEDVILKITGAPLGFAGPVGLKNKVKIIADNSIKGIKNAISGANKKDYHLKNICEGRDFISDVYLNITRPEEKDKCIKCGGELKVSRGIEVGHTFKLGLKYSEPMNLKFKDKDGKEKYIFMGCYGIGVSRMVAAMIEQSNDEKGIIWKLPVAPFEIEIIALNYEKPEIKKVSDNLYNSLKEKGIDVLLDDRNVSPGVKFNDADLIGIPFRIVVGKKVKEGKVEFSRRDNFEKQDFKIDCVEKVLEIINKEYEKFKI